MQANKFPHYLGAGIAAMAGVVVIANGMDATTALHQRAAKALQAEQVQAAIEAERSRVQNATADQRYRQGCILSSHQLSEGQTYPTVPVGETICDRHGYTAVVGDGGQIEQLARTTDIDVITGRLAQP